MAFFAQVGPDPYYQQAGQLGEALGLGVGQRMAQQRAQQQQALLSNALFGEQGQQLSALAPEQQIALAKQMQERQELARKEASERRQRELFSRLFPDETAKREGEISSEKKGVSKEREELSDAQIAAVTQENPVLGKLLQQQKEARRAEQTKASEIVRKEQLEFHRESQKFDEDLSKKSESAEKKLKAIEQQKKILPKLTKKDRIVTALFFGTKYENLVKSKNAQEFDSLVLPMLEGMRAMFGTRLSDADLKLVLQKIATSEKDPEANKAILDWQALEAKMDVEKRKIADQIRKENRGLRPLDYQDRINKKVDEKFGQEIDQTASRIMELEEDPQDFAKVTQRTKVPQGTPLDTKAIDLYLKIADNDPEKAMKLAKEDGYDF